MWKSIPQQRLLLYLLMAGAAPLFVVAVLFFGEKSAQDQIFEKMTLLETLVKKRELREAPNLAVRQHFHEPDHFYIDKHLETLIFLEPEIDLLQRLRDENSVSDDAAIRKRLDFLNSKENRLSFSEGSMQSHPLFQEVIETQTHPVEVNVEDLRKILSKIEGVEKGRPQLQMLDFKIERKKVTEKNETFSLSMKLLKREFTK